MAKVTIYMPDDLNGELAKISNVSSVCQRAIREELRTVNAMAQTQDAMDRIEVETEDRNGIDRTMSFVGRWLVEPSTPETRSMMPGTDAGVYWGVAITKRGRIAIYSAHCNRGQGTLTDYDDLDDAEREGVPSDIIADARGELTGEMPVIELDI
jgi:hypothetical protein